MFLKRHLYYRL